MKTWKLTIAYDGSKYSGWQDQQNAKTVAGRIRPIAEELLRSPVELYGAGRTDAGVHARGQVAHLRAAVSSAPPPAVIVSELNERLPADIAIVAAALAPNEFHARHDAIGRRYVYQIARRKQPFSKRYVWWVKEALDVAAMAQGARLFCGRHDFVRFRAPDPLRPDDSTIVVVEDARVDDSGDLILFQIEASHFLWRMVRRLTGALVRVGLGQLALDHLARLTEGEDVRGTDVAAWTAPSSGLFLESVRYRDSGEPGKTRNILRAKKAIFRK